MSFTLASWNVNFRRDVASQVAATLAHGPDIVVFQEVRAASFAELAARFAEAGLGYFATSHSAESDGRMRRFVVVASRFPVKEALAVVSPVPATSVCLEAQTPGGTFELVGVYVPSIARKDGIKVPTQHAMHARMASGVARPHVICGDFNSPKAESLAGEVELFFKPGRPVEYAGERALMHGLFELGMTDAFRACNGYGEPSPSWFWKNCGRTGGYRLDHIFVSRHFAVQRCWYDHSVRERGLSDHSMMCAELGLDQFLPDGSLVAYDGRLCPVPITELVVIPDDKPAHQAHEPVAVLASRLVAHLHNVSHGPHDVLPPRLVSHYQKSPRKQVPVTPGLGRHCRRIVPAFCSHPTPGASDEREVVAWILRVEVDKP